MSLYAITEEMQAVQTAFDRLIGDGDEADPEGASAALEHIDALAQAFDAKADSYAALIRNAETRAAARREEARRFAALAERDEFLATRLRLALMEAMQRTNRTKVQTERFQLSVRANGGKRPVLVDDEAALPPEFVVPVYSVKVDKDAIRQAIEAGSEVPGARLAERGTRLDLK
jgi:hypothetical protein